MSFVNGEPSAPGAADVFSQVAELKRQNAELLAINLILHERIKELDFSQHVFNDLFKNYNLDSTIKSILDMATKITCSEAGLIMLGDNGFRSFKIISALGVFELSLKEYLQNNTSMFLACASSQEMVLTCGDSAFEPLHNLDPSLRSLMAVPLKTESRVIGVIVLMHRHQGRDNHRIDYDENQRSTIMTFAKQAALILDNTRLKIEFGRKELYLKTITALTSAIDAKDRYTRNHSRNVARYAVVLGEKLGLSSEEIMNINYGAILHDIGKIGVPEATLNKPGRLTPHEFELIKTHPTIGVNILAPIDFLEEAMNVVRHHHERYDGSGYPSGLKGESIPYAARIVAIADAWDAMTSHRSYRRALTVEAAIRELQAGSGGQFDPAMVNIFTYIIQKNRI